MFRTPIALTAACFLLATMTASLAQEVPETLVVSFQKQKDPAQIQQHADKVANILSEAIGMPVEVVIPSSYGATIQAVISNKAHVAYVDSLPFLLARREAPVRLILAEVRDNRTDYDSLYLVRKDAPYKSLEDLRGERMMFTSPTSTSGYVMAYSRLVNEGLLKPEQNPSSFFGDVNYAGGYDRAMLAVANGQADACAVSDYAFEGERANVYLPKEQRDKLRVLAETPGVPTHLICLRSDLPSSLQQSIKEALLMISEKHPDLLADVYGAARLKAVDEDAHVQGTHQALKNTGLNLEKLVH